MFFRSRREKKTEPTRLVANAALSALDQGALERKAPAIDRTPDDKEPEPAPTKSRPIAATGNADVTASNGSRTASATGSAASTNLTTVNGAALTHAMLAPDAMQQRADQSHKLLQAFGSIVAIYLRSKAHRDMRLSDIENIVGPAITTGQFSIAEIANKKNGQITPAAVVLWASVSPAIDARLTAAPDQPFALAPADWTNGATIWIIEAVGDEKTVGAVIEHLRDTLWKGRTVKLRSVGASGRIETRVLGEKASA